MPYTFYYEELRLKFDVSVDTKADTFTLDVQDRRFESLPYRPCAIHLLNDDHGNMRDIRAAIEVNDIDILGSRKYRKQETWTWDVENFKNSMLEKLNNEKVSHIYVVISQGSSVAVNELLAELYVNIAETGLQSLTIDKLPIGCELDSMLINNIALKSSNLRIFGLRRSNRLQ